MNGLSKPRWIISLTGSHKPKLLASGLVESRPADVTNPFDYVMVRVVKLRLKDFEVAHLEARGSERHLCERGREEYS